jgi:arabinose-5-phosphate isomerase
VTTSAENLASTALASAARTLDIEIEALEDLRGRLGDDFVRAVEIMLACKGRVVVAGMGKSGQICRKIAATLSSTGTSSFFLHAAEAAHGDLGMFARGDVCIAISYSGTTQEVVALLPSIKRLGIPLIAITGGADSPLATDADAWLDVRVKSEACPLGLAPTASTTATLAAGDALAVAVLEAKGFRSEDFALLHPGGALGNSLVRVRELMHAGSEVPTVAADTNFRDTLERMTAGKLGTVGVVDSAGILIGVVTDGDIRRALLDKPNATTLDAAGIMTANPKTISAAALAAEALELMERHSITALFILSEDDSQPIGILHFHDLLRAGIA